MNNKIEIINEQFGNFMMAPTIPPPPVSSSPFTSPPLSVPSINNFKHANETYVIDNNVLYKKLIDLETEIKLLKNMIANINQPKPPYYYPMQSVSYGAPPMPMSHNINSYINTKPNPGQHF